jgi:hypothetical protein
VGMWSMAKLAKIRPGVLSGKGSHRNLNAFDAKRDLRLSVTERPIAQWLDFVIAKLLNALNREEPHLSTRCAPVP